MIVLEKTDLGINLRFMEVITSHIKLLIPYLVVDKNMAKLKTTLISLQTGNTDILSYVASLLNPLKIYRNQVYVKEI